MQEVFLPIDPQYVNAFKQESWPQWVKRLAAAVLTQAIKDIGRQDSKAKKWLFSDDPDHPFSFLNVCQVSELSPTRIRNGVRARYGL